MQQHFIDNKVATALYYIPINMTAITELESTTGENYPNVDSLL